MTFNQVRQILLFLCLCQSQVSRVYGGLDATDSLLWQIVTMGCFIHALPGQQGRDNLRSDCY